MSKKVFGDENGGRTEWSCGGIAAWFRTWFGIETDDHDCETKECERVV